MPSVSKSQQRIMAWSYACEKGKAKNCPSNIKKIGKSFKDKGDLRKMAKTKHKGLPERVSERYSIKDLIEGMSFTSYLIAEANLTPALRYIRSNQLYQELMSDPDMRPTVVGLARTLATQLGDVELNASQQNYINDRLSRLVVGGHMIGDWAGEREARQQYRDEKRQFQSDLAGPEQKAPRMSHARIGMDFMGDVKSARAKQEIGRFSVASPDEQSNRLAAASAAVPGVMPQRGDKTRKAYEIVRAGLGKRKSSEMIKDIMDVGGMTKAGATTYFYNAKKKVTSGEVSAPTGPRAGGGVSAPLGPRVSVGAPSGPRAGGGVSAPSGPRAGSKMEQATQIFQDMQGSRPSEIKRAFQEQLGISAPHASTYYYSIKKKYG